MQAVLLSILLALWNNKLEKKITKFQCLGKYLKFLWGFHLKPLTVVCNSFDLLLKLKLKGLKQAHLFIMVKESALNSAYGNILKQRISQFQWRNIQIFFPIFLMLINI